VTPGSDFHHEHGDVNYASEVNRIEKPCLFITGNAGSIAPTHKVEKILHRMTRCSDKSILRLSLENGCLYDYGHLDQIIGTRAAEEVFAPVLHWIFDHET